MKKQFTLRACAAAMVLLPWLAQAEPISFDQAGNVTGMTGVEVGVEYSYSYEKIQQQGVGTAIENNITQIPLFVHVGLPILEIKLSAPYGTVKNNVGNVQNGDFSGIQNVGLGLKTPLLPLPIFNVALGLNTVFPTAQPEKYIFGDGLKLNPYLALDIDIMILKLHANLGYEYRAEYQPSFDPTNATVNHSVKFKPGDATHWALGLEIPAGDLLYLMAELNGTSFGEVKVDSITVPKSAGSTTYFVPGLRLQKGPIKAKIGYAIPLEKQEDRPQFAPRADWKMIAGLSFLLGI